jgi:uncharacterized membrane protein (DUF4010 family)
VQQGVQSFLTPYLISVLVSTGMGLIIGLEREFRKSSDKDHFAGIRTFPLVCLLGCVITSTGNVLSVWVTVAGLISVIAFAAVTYYVRSTKGYTGITTEISLITTFVLGMMASQQLIKEALAAMVITTTLLTLKGQFHSFVLKLTEDELFAFVKFIVLCLLLFPFLPDVDYGPDGILNPKEIGFIVVVVSSLSFIGYLLIKFSDANKGILLTALLGGMVSSTATTWMFASRSSKSDSPQASLYSAGIVLASSIMFLRIVLVAFIFSQSLGTSLLLPCLVIFLCGLTFSITYIKKADTTLDNKAPFQLINPVNILSALGFGLLYITIAFLVYYGDKFLGNKGLILSGVIAGLTDVDAITINIAKLVEPTGNPGTFLMVVLMAAISNTAVKLIITSYRANPEVRKKVFYAMSAMLFLAIVFILTV